MRASFRLASGHGSAAPYGLAGIDGREHDGRRHRVGLAHVAQPLDRGRDRELGPAQPLDEVAALRQAGLLHQPQLAVDGREAARDALAEDGGARHDAVAVEQRLGQRPRPLARRRRRLEQALHERPAAAGRRKRRGRPGAAARPFPGAAARRPEAPRRFAAAATRRSSPRPPRRGSRARPASRARSRRRPRRGREKNIAPRLRRASRIGCDTSVAPSADCNGL